MKLLFASLYVGSIKGIPIRLHWSLLLLVAWLWQSMHGVGELTLVQSTLATLVVLVLLWGCILAHEFGHIFAARHYNCQTTSVYLSVLGGLAMIETLPDGGWPEVAIAAAGPAVSAAIAFACAIPLAVWHFFPAPDLWIEFVDVLFWTNAVLLGFNLLPAYPMDGGRILNGLLSLRYGTLRANRLTSILGVIFGLLFFVGGIVSWRTHGSLTLIGFFVLLVSFSRLAPPPVPTPKPT